MEKDHINNKEKRSFLLSKLPDPKFIVPTKEFIEKYGRNVYNDLVQYKDDLNAVPESHKRKRKRKNYDIKSNEEEIMLLLADDSINKCNEPLQDDALKIVVFGDESNNNIIGNNEFMILEEDNSSNYDNSKDAADNNGDDDGFFMVEEVENYLHGNNNNNDDDDDDDDTAYDNNNNNNDDDDDDWCSNIEEEENDIIYRMHGGGNCFENGTKDEDNDEQHEQEQDNIKSYFSDTYNLMKYCEDVAYKIKCRAEGIFNKNEEGMQDLFPDSSVNLLFPVDYDNNWNMEEILMMNMLML